MYSTEDSNNDLTHRFRHHPPKDDQSDRYALIRSVALQFASLIDRQCPPGREKDLALTNLEQAVMWANAAIARGE